jgi:hypothetical protein
MSYEQALRVVGVLIVLVALGSIGMTVVPCFSIQSAVLSLDGIRDWLPWVALVVGGASVVYFFLASWFVVAKPWRSCTVKQRIIRLALVFFILGLGLFLGLMVFSFYMFGGLESCRPMPMTTELLVR